MIACSKVPKNALKFVRVCNLETQRTDVTEASFWCNWNPNICLFPDALKKTKTYLQSHASYEALV